MRGRRGYVGSMAVTGDRLDGGDGGRRGYSRVVGGLSGIGNRGCPG